jgi:hypothetical protein
VTSFVRTRLVNPGACVVGSRGARTPTARRHRTSRQQRHRTSRHQQVHLDLEMKTQHTIIHFIDPLAPVSINIYIVLYIVRLI